MTRNLLLFIALMALSTASAQNTYLFKNEYKPEKKYKSEAVVTSENVTDFSGNEQILNNLRSSGVQMPMIFNSSSAFSSEIETGKRQKNGDMPITIRYGKAQVKVTTNGETITEESPYANLKIEGKYDKNNTLSLGMVIGEKVTPEIEQAVKLSLKSGLQEAEFPKTPMKIGDSFSREVPISLPMPGSAPVDITIKTDYILKEVTGNNAVFSIRQVIRINLSENGIAMEATGEGDGILDFNISEHYVSRCKSSMNIYLSTTMDENMTMTLKSVTNTDVKITMQ